MVDANGVEQGLMVGNLMLATQALGLGGHPFCGGKGRVTMLGGESAGTSIGGKGSCGSLGFTSHRVPDGAPLGAGRADPGRACPASSRAPARRSTPTWTPRWTSWSACAGAPDGTFSAPEKQRTPWRSPEVARAVPRPSDEAIEATKALCRYVWETYGRFPATIDPFLMTVWYQAHHLDVGFYDRLLPGPEALPAHVRTHMTDWHGE